MNHVETEVVLQTDSENRYATKMVSSEVELYQKNEAVCDDRVSVIYVPDTDKESSNKVISQAKSKGFLTSVKKRLSIKNIHSKFANEKSSHFISNVIFDQLIDV